MSNISPALSLSSAYPASTSSTPSLKRKTMSVTQTYYLAHQARGKLSSEASRADHNLRLLVGHANLLDSLMLELAEAEQEQESWFNQSVKKATKSEEPRHIQWADTVVEETDEEEFDSESEYDSDEELEEEEDEIMTGVASMQRIPTPIITTFTEMEDDYEEFDDEEDLESLTLTRTQSHSNSPHSPPELMEHDDSDSSSEDDMPPSPPSDILPTFSEKQRQQIATTAYYSKSQKPSIPQSSEPALFGDGFYLPPRTQPGLISAISVY